MDGDEVLSTHLVRVQLPVGIGADSEPEPDFSVLPRALAREFRLARTQPDRCDLIIEVAATSLAYDRGEKLSLYAEAGFPEC